MMKKQEVITRIAVSILLAIMTMTAVGCKKQETPTVSVSSVSVSPTALRLKVGETIVIKATVQPADATNKEISWLSSDPTIATVSPTGEVRGLTPGKVTITAISKEGAKTASCIIQVKNVVTEEFTALSQKIMTLESDLATAKQEFEDLKKSTQSAKDKASTAKVLIEKITEQQNKIPSLREEVKAKMDDLHPEELTILTEKISALNNEAASLADEVKAYQVRLDKILREGKGSVSDIEIIRL